MNKYVKTSWDVFELADSQVGNNPEVITVKPSKLCTWNGTSVGIPKKEVIKEAKDLGDLLDYVFTIDGVQYGAINVEDDNGDCLTNIIAYWFDGYVSDDCDGEWRLLK